jgi:pyruvate/2-oxoglutarate dehydrogenase complex dihydrolipoamide dehydrogenase (E3) component
MKQYDLIWIGTGQATGAVIPRLVAAGKTVAVIEGGRIGGSCVNYGCTPTKTLVSSARAAHMVRRGADFGVNVESFCIDFDKVIERQNTIRNNSSKGLESWIGSLEGVDFYAEYAHFEDDHTVRVGEAVIFGETIVIHTGARARKPPIPGLDEVNWLSNVRLLDLTVLPRHLVIIGGSYISLEFAQVFRRFGSEVTVLERGSQLMFREDADIAEIAKDVLLRESIQIEFNMQVDRVVAAQGTTDGHSAEVFYTQGGKSKSVQGSHLMVAAGRVPNTDKLKLDAAGVKTNERGFIPVNDVMQTNVSHIYAVGDVNGEAAFTHTSVNDGEIFWDNYSDTVRAEDARNLTDRITTYAMFIDPPLGRVGMSEKEARKSDRNVLMATLPMARISRAREKDETDGLVKILVDADSEEFLGATILGVGGDEVINMFTPFMYTGQSYKLFRRAVLVHPTVAELMPWILDNLKPLNDE